MKVRSFAFNYPKAKGFPEHLELVVLNPVVAFKNKRNKTSQDI